MQENWVQSQGWEDPLEKKMATHSSILVWRIPWTEEPDGLQFTSHKELNMIEQLTLMQYNGANQWYYSGFKHSNLDISLHP